MPRIKPTSNINGTTFEAKNGAYRAPSSFTVQQCDGKVPKQFVVVNPRFHHGNLTGIAREIQDARRARDDASPRAIPRCRRGGNGSPSYQSPTNANRRPRPPTVKAGAKADSKAQTADEKPVKYSPPAPVCEKEDEVPPEPWAPEEIECQKCGGTGTGPGSKGKCVGHFHNAFLHDKMNFLPHDEALTASPPGSEKDPYDHHHVVVGQLPFSYDANALITALFGSIGVRITKYDRMYKADSRPNGQARVYLESEYHVKKVMRTFHHRVLLDVGGAWVEPPTQMPTETPAETPAETPTQTPTQLASYCKRLPKEYVDEEAKRIGAERVSRRPLSFVWPEKKKHE